MPDPFKLGKRHLTEEEDTQAEAAKRLKHLARKPTEAPDDSQPPTPPDAFPAPGPSCAAAAADASSNVIMQMPAAQRIIGCPLTPNYTPQVMDELISNYQSKYPSGTRIHSPMYNVTYLYTTLLYEPGQTCHLLHLSVPIHVRFNA